MAYFEIGYIERYCKKYNKAEWDDFEDLNSKGIDCFVHCPLFPSSMSYACNQASELIQYKGFTLKNYDIYKNYKNDDESDLLILETNIRNYDCFYLKMDGQILIDLRDDYKEGEIDGNNV